MESLGNIISQMKNSDLRKRTEQLTASILNDPLVLKLKEAHPEVTDSTAYVEYGEAISMCKGRQAL